MRKFGKLRSALVLSAAAIGVAAAASAVAQQRAVSGGQCTLESVRALVAAIPADPSVASVGIDSVKAVTTPVAHCEVIGHTVTRNPGPNTIGWSALLPDQGFAARYLVQGQGGKILTADSPGTRNLLARGIVFSSSDTGAKGPAGRWAVLSDPGQLMNRDYRGAHVSVLATKALTRAYYRMPARARLFSYHTGCSAGGAMTMAALRNYPRDFDGAVTGTATTGGSNWTPHIMQYLLAHPDSWLSPAKLKTLETAVGKTCTGPDGLVRNPKVCGFRPETLQCTGASTDQCLTPAEIGLVKRITGPYPVALGKTRAGYTMAMPTGWTALIGPDRPTLARPDNPWAPNRPPMSHIASNMIFQSSIAKDGKFDYVKDARFDDPAFWQRIGGGMSDDVSKDPVLAFRRAGGNLITYSGLAENSAPPLAEAEYYEAIKRSDPRIDTFMRVYELPGVMHCGGGPGPQNGPDRMLEAMIAWVERGQVPGPLVANRPSAPAPSTTLLCPYPLRARFVYGQGASASICT